VEYYDETEQQIEKECERIQQITEDYFNLFFDNTKLGVITTRGKIREHILEHIDYSTFNIKETNNLYELEDKGKIFKKFYKRYCQFKVDENNTAYIKNLQPNKYCCADLKKSFSICSQHGLLCPDYYIRHDGRDYFINAINATYKISFCPYCGEYLYNKSDKNYEQEIDL
jgi:hypothetical protein